MVEETERRCYKCNCTYPIEHFFFINEGARRPKQYRRRVCKKCISAQRRERYNRNKGGKSVDRKI